MKRFLKNWDLLIPWWKERDHLVLIVIFLISLGQLALLLKVSPSIVRGDGVGYYAYLRSLFFDRDLDFRNEYTYFAAILPESSQPLATRLLSLSTTKKGYVYNPWPVGPAILWTLFFLTGHASAWVLNSLGYNVPLDGYSYPYQIAIAVGSALYAFVGLLLVYEISKQYFPKRVCLLALLAIWFSTSLAAYMYFMPSMSHACSLFSVSFFLFLWHRTRQARSLMMWMILGLAAGLMPLQRFQDGVFAMVVVIEWLLLVLARVREGQWKKLLVLGVAPLAFAFGAVLAFLPQMMAWRTLYGTFLPSAQRMSESRGFDWLHPRPLRVLVSPNHGLISWTPIVAFSLLGLYFLAKKDRSLTFVLAAAFLLQLYVISSYPHWHQGASFGGRMFISCTPAFILGLAALVDWLRERIPLRVPIVVGTLLVAWNYLLLFQYGTGMIPRQGSISWAEVLYNSVVVVPSRVVEKSWTVLFSCLSSWLVLPLILLVLSLGWMLATRYRLIKG